MGYNSFDMKIIQLIVLAMFTFLLLTACVPLADVDQGEVLDEPYPSDNPYDRRLSVPTPGEEDFFRYIRCRKFLDETVRLRRKIVIKQFEFFETARKQELQAEAFEKESELRNLMDELYILTPPDCKDLIMPGY